MADGRGQGLEAVKGGPANFQPERERPLKPTVFVGLGGTGLKVLARFRRRLYDRYGDADYWKIYQWLGIDADQGALSEGGVEKQKGLPVAGKDRLCTGMDPSAMKYVLDNLRGLYGHIGEWFRHDSIDVSAWSFLEGAGQNRVAGRVLFVKKIDEIRQALLNRIFDANSQTARDDALRKGAHFFDADAGGPDHLKLQAVDVVLVGSLAGGTGSGSFLDCAYLLQALQQEKAAPVGDVRGMFLLPDVFLGEVKQPQQKEIIQANGYAALRELEHYNSGRANPFSTLAWGKVGQQLREIRATPFANCYLFSLSNGRPLENAGEMYDLLADALAFSTGGGQLASKIRSCWSNAQSSVYSGRLVYRQFADATSGELHSAGEMGGDGENDGRTILYERTWSTRYSSMGTASLTMKLPELRRLAAVREVRRMLDMEAQKITADADAARAAGQGRLATAGHAADSSTPGASGPADAAALQQTKEEAALFLAAKNLLKKLPSNVAERIAKTAGANTAQEAETGARTLLALLHGIAAATESPTTPANQDAKMMIAEARNEATQAAHAAHASWSAGGDLARLAARLTRAALALKAETPQPKASAGSTAPLQIQSTPLEQWKDLDAHESGPLDLLFGGLEGRARRIIRPAFKDWLTAECDGYVKRIGTALQRHYLLQAAAELEGLTGKSRAGLEELRRTVNEETVAVDTREKSEIAELEPWRAALRQMQNDLTQQFHESRNTIISTDLAAKAADRPGEPKSDAEQKLDVEIDAVLDSPRFHGPHRTPGERLTAARRFALGHFATEEGLAATPETLLQAKRAHEARMGPRLLERLVDGVATKMLEDFPPVHDVFEALVARKTSNLTGAALPAVMARASAYWNLNTTIDQYKQTVQHTLLSGAVIAPGAAPLHERTEALEFLKQKHWDFYSPDQKEHGAEGELVLVHEAHGFALQSLVEIDQWKAAYDRVAKEGQQAARHLDYRVVPLLPELVAVDFPRAMDEVDSWDLALLGIVLGRFFKWSEKQATFMYNPTGGQPLEVGPNYEAIALWLRSATRYRRKLSADVDAWFTERAQLPGRGQTPEERSALARREADRLVLLGLVLDLLGRHCFKAIRAQPIDISPPPHTITVRLLARKVNRFLKILTDNYKELDPKAMEADMVHQVQRFVQFVGPRVNGNGVSGVAAATSRTAPRDRILQLLPDGKENEDGGKAVLSEAFGQAWYEEAAVPENVKTLFPEYGEYAHSAAVM